MAEDATGEQLQTITTAIERRGIEVVPGAHEPLKTAPKGCPKDHPRITLLRYKGLVAWQQWPVAAWLGTASAKRRIVDFLRDTRPLNDWFARHVDPAS